MPPKTPLSPGTRRSQLRRTVPSFKGCQAASVASSRTKRANRYVDTSPELLLRRELSRRQLIYRVNVNALRGKPDLAFDDAHVLVFCDGDFWHGRNWRRLKKELARRANAAYWIAKIAYNRARDARNRQFLRRHGWHVVRLWESDIRKNPALAAARVKNTIDQHLQRSTSAARA